MAPIVLAPGYSFTKTQTIQEGLGIWLSSKDLTYHVHPGFSSQNKERKCLVWQAMQGLGGGQALALVLSPPISVWPSLCPIPFDPWYFQPGPRLLNDKLVLTSTLKGSKGPKLKNVHICLGTIRSLHCNHCPVG